MSEFCNLYVLDTDDLTTAITGWKNVMENEDKIVPHASNTEV